MNIILTPKQDEFAAAVFSGEYTSLLFGGAIRGGKTVCVLSILFMLCKTFDKSRWAIVRKDLPTLRRNTLPSFESIRPTNFVGPINQSSWTAKCTNGSEIIFFPESKKEDPELNRWRGLEVNGFVLEEMNELSEESYFKAIERAGSWKCEPMPQPLILGTCNPSQGYVKKRFYNPWRMDILKPPMFYLPSKVTDNPHNPQEYLKSLETLKESNPEAYRRFVEGDWDSADAPDQLIKFEWILAAQQCEPTYGENRLGVDVARFGKDKTVLALIDGNSLVGLKYFDGFSIDRTADTVQTVINEEPVKASNVNVDVVGLGAGVADVLRRRGFEVGEIVSGAKAVDRFGSFYKFKNLRSQMWWEYREKLREGSVSIEVNDSKLIEDLTAPRYRIDADKMITVESKEDIKRRIGRSTDAGDALVYAEFRLPEKKKFIFV